MNTIVKKIGKSIFISLPFRLQVLLSRNRPEVAFYIKKLKKTVRIDYFLRKYSMDIDVSTDLQRRMLSGSYESTTMYVLRKFVKTGDVCLDIGANVGAITIALADLVGPSGVVHSFEPGPPFFFRMKSNIGLNPEITGRVHLHQMGLSNKAGSFPWQASDTYTGTASMDPALHLTSLKTEILPAVRLDDFAPIQGLPKINLIKVDVDGLELQIFRGAVATLKRFRPIVYFETTMWNEEQKQAAKDIESLLVELGYRLFRVEHKTYSISPVQFPNFSENTLAVPKEISNRI